MRSSTKQQNGQPGWQRLLVVTVTSWIALMAGPATLLAQSGAEEESESGLIEEIIVTATRREESLMEVPIAVTAITGEELQDFGVLDLTYISQMSPNTTLEVSRGTNSTLTAFIRGVGQQDRRENGSELVPRADIPRGEPARGAISCRRRPPGSHHET